MLGNIGSVSEKSKLAPVAAAQELEEPEVVAGEDPCKLKVAGWMKSHDAIFLSKPLPVEPGRVSRAVAAGSRNGDVELARQASLLDDLLGLVVALRQDHRRVYDDFSAEPTNKAHAEYLGRLEFFRHHVGGMLMAAAGGLAERCDLLTENHGGRWRLACERRDWQRYGEQLGIVQVALTQLLALEGEAFTRRLAELGRMGGGQVGGQAQAGREVVDDWMSAKDIGDKYGIAAGTLTKAVERGAIIGEKRGSGRARWYYREASIRTLWPEKARKSDKKAQRTPAER
jgi:hypothetical protein